MLKRFFNKQAAQSANKEVSLSGVGVGLRNQHLDYVIRNKPKVDWFEVHTENFFSLDSLESHLLAEIRRDYPLSAHSVGLSLGSYKGIEKAHLKKIKDFVDKFEPSLVSDHLSWSNSGDKTIPDLLPIPLTNSALKITIDNVDNVQNTLGREILVENPSNYLNFANPEMEEWEFLQKLSEKTGCCVLLDVNNIVVSSHNIGTLSPKEYIDAIRNINIGEIHLAGHKIRELASGKKIRIDDHGSQISEEVWDIYDYTVKTIGNIPTLIEWDTDVPDFFVLEEEQKKAKKILSNG